MQPNPWQKYAHRVGIRLHDQPETSADEYRDQASLVGYDASAVMTVQRTEAGDDKLH